MSFWEQLRLFFSRHPRPVRRNAMEETGAQYEHTTKRLLNLETRVTALEQNVEVYIRTRERFHD